MFRPSIVVLSFAVLQALAPAVPAAPVSKQELIELHESNVDVDLIVSLVRTDCVDFELDAATLLELSPRIEKRVLEAIFDCTGGEVATPPDAVTDPAMDEPALPPDDTTGLIRKVRTWVGRDSGFLELYSDRFVWAKWPSTEGPGSRTLEQSYDDVVGFEPIESPQGKPSESKRRSALRIHMSDGRSMVFDPVEKPKVLSGNRYSPDDVADLATELNRYVQRHRRQSELTPDVYQWREFVATVKSEKAGTFGFLGDLIEFVPKKEAQREEYGFRLMYSRVSEVRILGRNEALIGFDTDRPLDQEEQIDLELRDGWIRLKAWEGKGIVRELENRGIETGFE